MALVTQTFSDIITFTRASSATYFDSAGVLQTATTNTPRFDYDPSTLEARGLLIEEARTNSIRNNTMVGAVAGTPGTLPTNWISQNIGGIALTEIVGTGTEDGIAYVDVRYTGTTSSTALGGVLAEQATQIAALSGQTWASSFFLRIVGGSTANISDIANSIQERDAGGALLASTNTTVTPTGAALNTQRFSTTRTLTDASTAFVGQRISLTPVSGAAIDITLRIGLPQLELGAFATSVVPTTSSAVTRAADVASVNTLSPWFSAAEGTLYAEWTRGYTGNFSNYSGQATLLSGTSQAIAAALTVPGSTAIYNSMIVGGVQQLTYQAVTTLTTNKVALAYAENNTQWAGNGVSKPTDTVCSVPTVTSLALGYSATGTSYLNGYLRRVSYYPRRLSQAELITITTT